MAQGPEVWFTMAHLAFDPIRYGGPVDPQRVAPAQLMPIGGREVLFSAQIGDIAFEIRPLAALKAIDKAFNFLDVLHVDVEC
jgi:hypothetical protein